MSVQEICEKNQHGLKESVDITLSTSLDLAIECLGVRVATIVVKMMKRKFATSEFSTFGCAIPGLLAMLHRMVFAVHSHSSAKGCFSFLFSSKICERLRGGINVFSRSHRSSSPIIIIGHQEDGVFVPVPPVPGCAVGDVDRREVVQVSTNIFCPSMNFPRFTTLFVILPSERDGVVTVLSCSSSGIHRFPTVFLPLTFAVSFTS